MLKQAVDRRVTRAAKATSEDVGSRPIDDEIRNKEVGLSLSKRASQLT
jgi:hypothetical protein